MLITGIEAEGFGNIGSKKVHMKLKEGNLYNISGKNGSGKSTLYVDIITWVFYGSVSKRIYIGDIINDDCVRCKCTVIVDNKKVTRCRSFKSGETIFYNHKLISQKELDTIIGIDKDIFLNAVVFGKSMSGFVLLNDGGKKKLISKIQVSMVDEKLEKLIFESKELEIELETINDSIVGVKNDIERYIESTEKIKKSISSNTDIRSRVAIKDLDKIKSLKQVAEKKRNEINNRMHELKDKMRMVIDLIQNNEFIINKNDFQIKALKTNIQSVSKMSKCDRCMKTITDKEKNDIMKTMAVQIKELENDNRILGTKDSKLNDRLLKIDKKYNAVKKEDNDISETIARYCDRETGLVANLKVFKCDKKKNIRAAIQDNRRMIISNKKVLKEELYPQLKRIRNKLAAYAFWIQKIKYFRANIFNAIVNKFIPYCNSYLATITDNRFSISMNVGLKGKKNITDKFSTVIFDNGKKVNFERLSSGEKKIVSMSMSLAFAMVINNFYAKGINYMVFDEAFDALDSEHRSRVVDILVRYARTTKKSIVLITHEETERENVINKVVSKI
jgi:DNA repair exonuclease SbcCD ATPase subunit